MEEINYLKPQLSTCNLKIPLRPVNYCLGVISMYVRKASILAISTHLATDFIF